ncbi:MAG: tRNA pseudouridine(55) synthase TruB [Myxococcota bacterium]
MKNTSKKKGEISGIFVVDKPEGVTSREIDNRIKKIAKPSKVGHLGTLDPFAGGVLPILIGSATRLADYLDEQPKVYTATIAIGISTDTWDITGDVDDVDDASKLPDELILEALLSFEGEITQKIPPYSAAKRGGKRSYDLARKGESSHPGTKRVTVYKFENIQIARDIKEYEPGKKIQFAFINFILECSRGTYVRSIAFELGERLKMPATLVYLRRINASGFSDNIATKIDSVDDKTLEKSLKDKIISPRYALPHLPEIILNDQLAEKVKNGFQLRFDGAPGRYKLIHNDSLLALAEKSDGDHKLKYLCVLAI